MKNIFVTKHLPMKSKPCVSA